MEGDTGGKGLVDNPFAFCHQLRGEPARNKEIVSKADQGKCTNRSSVGVRKWKQAKAKLRLF